MTAQKRTDLFGKNTGSNRTKPAHITERLSFGKQIVRSHRQLWVTDVWKAWNNLSFANKLLWILILNNTIALLTLFEVLIFKH